MLLDDLVVHRIVGETGPLKLVYNFFLFIKLITLEINDFNLNFHDLIY